MAVCRRFNLSLQLGNLAILCALHIFHSESLRIPIGKPINTTGNSSAKQDLQSPSKRTGNSSTKEVLPALSSTTTNSRTRQHEQATSSTISNSTAKLYEQSVNMTQTYAKANAVQHDHKASGVSQHKHTESSPAHQQEMTKSKASTVAPSDSPESAVAAATPGLVPPVQANVAAAVAAAATYAAAAPGSMPRQASAAAAAAAAAAYSAAAPGSTPGEAAAAGMAAAQYAADAASAAAPDLVHTAQASPNLPTWTAGEEQQLASQHDSTSNVNTSNATSETTTTTATTAATPDWVGNGTILASRNLHVCPPLEYILKDERLRKLRKIFSSLDYLCRTTTEAMWASNNPDMLVYHMQIQRWNTGNHFVIFAGLRDHLWASLQQAEAMLYMALPKGLWETLNLESRTANILTSHGMTMHIDDLEDIEVGDLDDEIPGFGTNPLYRSWNVTNEYYDLANMPAANGSYILPSNIDVVMKNLGLETRKLPVLFPQLPKSTCPDCGDPLPDIAAKVLRGALRRREDNDPLPFERPNGRQELSVYNFGGMPTSVEPWYSEIEDGPCIPGARVIATSRGVGTDGVDGESPCRGELPGDDKGSLYFLLLIFNQWMAGILGTGLCPMPGKVLWDLAAGSGGWVGSAGQLKPWDLRSDGGLKLDEMKAWAEELKVKAFAGSQSDEKAQAAYYRLELLQILLARNFTIPADDGINLDAPLHEIKMGSFKHAYMNAIQVQTDETGLYVKQCDPNSNKERWNQLTEWPLSGTSDEQMMGVASSNPDMFMLHTAYSKVLDRRWFTPELAGYNLLYYFCQIMYFGRPAIFVAGTKMMGWNYIMSSTKPLPDEDCMNKHGYPKAHLQKCRLLMKKELFIIHLIQHPKTLNCIVAFRGSLTEADWDKNEWHFKFPATDFCGKKVHKGYDAHLKELLFDKAYQHMRTYLPKCRNVAAIGHSLGAATVEMFMGCIHTGGAGAAKADWDKMAWNTNSTPGLLPVMNDTDLDCDPVLHKDGFCTEQGFYAQTS
eukprot:gnl/TRDRNA2_/TRDRNA2_176775_c0_seq6.p1 gnl/TRDRNA2_/TRDRNA2_176775_c0~~gnl/TRDRNA2_/TRDRNA2_176775_c0_seq6.p1  ORF type:complete len:1010 (+),score=125.97 gnl/TRDRNA2_/TRDRNA2_176775_c0_seq6:72-3101(+)